MSNVDSDEYQVYLADQKADTIGAGPDDKYLDYLTNEILPNFDYSGAAVLDIGGSEFKSWEYFIEKYNNRITGIDIGEDGLKLCKDRNKDGMIELDAHFMDEHFPEESFDFIYASHSFEHMYDLPRVLRNCFKIAKPGAYMYFALPMPSYNWKRGHWYDVPNNKVMLDMCSEAGFRTVLHSEWVRDLRFRPEQEMIGLVQK